MISFTDTHQSTNDLFYMPSIKSDLDDSNGSNGSSQSPQNSRTSEQRTLVSPPGRDDSELIIKSKQSEQGSEPHILSDGQHQGQFILTLDNIKPELKDTETITVTIPPANENNGSPNIPYTIGKQTCPKDKN